MSFSPAALAKLFAFTITILIGGAVPGGATTSVSQVPRPVTIPAPAAATDALHSSVNWAGYVAPEASYTSVSGSWSVPRVQNPGANTADATWVGIGGVSSNDLIQAGTETIPSSAGARYLAWYELLPGNSQTVPLAVSPGDSVSVSITRKSGDAWLISFANNTTGHTYQTEAAYDSSLSSAEWIEEIPVANDVPLSLDNFGSIDFSGGFAIKDGNAVTIAGSGAAPLTMESAAGAAEASPSALGADGSSFSVARTDAAADALALTPSGSVVSSALRESSGDVPIEFERFGHRHRMRIEFGF